MYDNVGTEVKWFAENRSCKGVVHDQWNSHCMGDICKAFNVKYSQRRIRNRLAEYKFRIFLETCFDFVVGHIFINIDTLNAKLL